MIDIKNEQEIEYMRQGGKILSEVLHTVLSHVKPGISEKELDQLADRLILEKGGEPGFKRVEGYHHATCISTNNVVVHGIPGSYVLKKGDIIGIDCGVFYKGFHTDMSETIRVADTQEAKDTVDRFLETGKKALEAAIKQAKPGNHIGHISKTIQDIVEGHGYSVVRSLIGHGVGRSLHEEPEVPGFLSASIAKTPKLVPGMTIAIEVIYNMGHKEVVYANKDGWTIKTKDNSLSGVFERTVAITNKGHQILTP